MNSREEHFLQYRFQTLRPRFSELDENNLYQRIIDHLLQDQTDKRFRVMLSSNRRSLK